MRRLRTPLMVMAACAMLGCSNLRPDKAYVEADRATFDTVAPVIRALADGDPSNDPDLTSANGQGLILTLDTWEQRLVTAERAVR